MTAARKTKPRSPEYIERKRVREAQKRRIAREAKGFASVEAFRKFAAEQAHKLRAARLAVIQPSIAKRQTMQAVNKPGETVEQFLAKGGVIERLPGYTHTTYSGGLPVRHLTSKGAHAA